MARRTTYDVNAEWVDPFEARRERRASPRFRTQLRMTLAVDIPEVHRRLVGPGIVSNLSESGAELVTKHRLVPKQHVMLTIPADSLTDGPCLVEKFVGRAEVVRVNAGADKCSRVAVRFSNTLTDDMEFAVFVDHLRSLSSIQNHSITSA